MVFEDCDIITLFKREIQIIDGDQKDDFLLWKVQIKKNVLCPLKRRI